MVNKTLKLNSGWSYCTEQILELVPYLPINTTELSVLEFGAGDSSDKIFTFLREKYENLKYCCYETNNRWAPNNSNIEVVMYNKVEDVVLKDEYYDLILVDGPTGVTRKYWYEKLKNVVKDGTVIHIDDYDHYQEFEEELKKNLVYEELYRKSRKFKGEKSWLTVKINIK